MSGQQLLEAVMHIISRFLAIAGVALIGVAQQASAATTLYDNGPIDGTIDAFKITDSFAIADSFTLSQSSVVTGVNFGVWAFPGDTISTVDWGITSASNTFPINGTASVTNGAPTLNGYGYDVMTDGFSTGSVFLAAGTYWLVLQNAVTSHGDPVFWDQNNGPSCLTSAPNGQSGVVS